MTITAKPVTMRDAFPPNLVSKLPKPMKSREDMDKLPKAKCQECGGYHATSMMMHLDYVGHAALTDRLLDVDPSWGWEPVAFGQDGLPAFDNKGGLWIRLTVLGVTRLGYGNATGKPTQDAGSREKEVIGDAMRNAAMRFGAALDLWHKGNLHAHREEQPGIGMSEGNLADWTSHLLSSTNVGELKTRLAEAEAACNEVGDQEALAAVRNTAATKAQGAKIATDNKQKATA
jgi:hypothetical protein